MTVTENLGKVSEFVLGPGGNARISSIPKLFTVPVSSYLPNIEDMEGPDSDHFALPVREIYGSFPPWAHTRLGLRVLCIPESSLGGLQEQGGGLMAQF